MKLLSTTDSLSALSKGPLACAIGVYDAVHLGHQAIIKQLHKKTTPNGKRCIVTFSPHPLEILTSRPYPLIVSLPHRLNLLKSYGIDYVLTLPFTEALASLSYTDFLLTLRKKIPFSHLIFGEDAVIGKDRLGNPSNIQKLAKTTGFTVDYIKKENYQKKIISSRAIRKAIQERELKQIKKMLARPYSIRVPYSPLELKCENKTTYKWSISCHNLCPLPSGVYAVDLESPSGKTAAIAVITSATHLDKTTTLHLNLFLSTPPKSAPYLNITFINYLKENINTQTLETSIKQTLSLRA